jgi:hypothetical protein
MKNWFFAFSLLVIVVFANCKKQSAKEEVVPGGNAAEYDLNGKSRFLKELSVPGSAKISFDSLTASFSVKMPENYAVDQIDILLSLYGGIKLLDSNAVGTADRKINFAYKGREPLRFSLQEPNGSKKNFTVYVEVPGTPVIELLSKSVPLSSGPIQLPIKIISGLGTTPAFPGQGNPSVRFIDRKSSYLIEGSFYNNLVYAHIQDAGMLINSRTLALELSFGEGKKVTFENITFKRGLPQAELLGYENILIPKTDGIRVYGGYFSSVERYTARLSSDFLPQPIVVNMKYTDSLQMSSEIPQDVPVGILPGYFL